MSALSKFCDNTHLHCRTFENAPLLVKWGISTLLWLQRVSRGSAWAAAKLKTWNDDMVICYIAHSFIFGYIRYIAQHYKTQDYCFCLIISILPGDALPGWHCDHICLQSALQQLGRVHLTDLALQLHSTVSPLESLSCCIVSRGLGNRNKGIVWAGVSLCLCLVSI